MPSSGYGYNDRGREELEKIYADVFECEAALVRHNITSGTQTLAIGLFGLLRPGDTLYSVTGKPYDTLEEVIGLRGEPGNGSLADFGVKYAAQEMTADGNIDIDKMCSYLKSEPSVKVVFIQRSKGYAVRKTLSAEEIGQAVKAAKAVKPEVFVIVDNCYGEFCDEHEPTYYGADLCMGSLIKIRAAAWPRPADILPVLPKQSSFARIGSPAPVSARRAAQRSVRPRACTRDFSMRRTRSRKA